MKHIGAPIVMSIDFRDQIRTSKVDEVPGRKGDQEADVGTAGQE